jgi:hypothetical protein
VPAKLPDVRTCPCPVCRDEPQSVTARVHAGINRLVPSLDERSRRQFVGLWATHLGRGGVQQIARITGLSRTTILRGQRELAGAVSLASGGRIRAAGGGRQRAEKNTKAC